jgi:hypothetical protein
VIGPALENSPWAPSLWLAERLQLANRLPLRRSFPSPTDRLKLVVFAPRGYEDAFIEAVAQGEAVASGVTAIAPSEQSVRARIARSKALSRGPERSDVWNRPRKRASKPSFPGTRLPR